MSGQERIKDQSLGFEPAEWTETCNACENAFHPTYESQISYQGGVVMLCNRCAELHTQGILWE